MTEETYVMTQAGSPFQSGFNQPGHLRDHLCRSFLMICIKILAISILIQISIADASAEWIIMSWRTFQVKKELIMQPRQEKVIKQGKTETGKSSKVYNAGAQRLREALWNEYDGQSFYVSGLSARIWGNYLRRTDISPVCLKRGIQDETLFGPDLFRDMMTRDNLQINPLSGGAPAKIKEEGAAHYIRLSFFNHDMKDLSRDIPERHAGRYSSWEALLFPSSGASSQPGLETMGKIFEPKIDLGIEF